METTNFEVISKLKSYLNDVELENWWNNHSIHYISTLTALYNPNGGEDLREIYRLNRIDLICKRNETATKFKEVLQSKDIDFTIDFDRNDPLETAVLFGVRLKKNGAVYHWFELNKYGNMDYCVFIQSYSQNTGVTEKGFRWGMDIERKLSKKLGVSYLSELFK